MAGAPSPGNLQNASSFHSGTSLAWTNFPTLSTLHKPTQPWFQSFHRWMSLATMGAPRSAKAITTALCRGCNAQRMWFALASARTLRDRNARWAQHGARAPPYLNHVPCRRSMALPLRRLPRCRAGRLHYRAPPSARPTAAHLPVCCWHTCARCRAHPLFPPPPPAPLLPAYPSTRGAGAQRYGALPPRHSLPTAATFAAADAAAQRRTPAALYACLPPPACYNRNAGSGGDGVGDAMAIGENLSATGNISGGIFSVCCAITLPPAPPHLPGQTLDGCLAAVVVTETTAAAKPRMPHAALYQAWHSSTRHGYMATFKLHCSPLLLPTLATPAGVDAAAANCCGKRPYAADGPPWRYYLVVDVA